MKSKVFETIKEIALKNEGKCISENYLNNKTKLRFTCKKEHIWDAIPSNILRGHWCKICGNEKQGTKKANSINPLISLAKSKNGKLLSDIYKNNRSKLKWQCEYGHIWEAVPSSIERGSWCPFCSGKDKTTNYKKIKELVESKNGRLLSSSYETAKKSLEFQCEIGHNWKSTYDSVMRGSWCPFCYNQKRGIRNTGTLLNELNELAVRNKGKLISKQYLNSKTPLKWQCESGHLWESRYEHVLNGSWCPICSSGISERLARLILEHITNQPFLKKRPAWLKNNEGKRLELDGYNEDLKIAFEYQGIQHFKFIKFFHGTNTKFEKRKEDDLIKKKLCKDNGVFLIEVGYDLEHDEFYDFLFNQLKEYGEKIITRRDRFDFKKIVSNNQEQIERFKLLAKEKNGKCLSEIFLSSKTKLKWQCEYGHIWEAVPSSIERGSWCPRCGNEQISKKLRKYSTDFFSEIAKRNGGELTNGEYKNLKSRFGLKCSFGHIWNTQASVLKAGHWCPFCRKVKRSKNNNFDKH